MSLRGRTKRLPVDPLHKRLRLAWCFWREAKFSLRDSWGFARRASDIRIQDDQVRWGQ